MRVKIQPLPELNETKSITETHRNNSEKINSTLTFIKNDKQRLPILYCDFSHVTLFDNKVG